MRTQEQDLRGQFVRIPQDPMSGIADGHRALVIDVDGDDWVLELNCNPDPAEYGENTMLWPKSEPLWVVR